MSKKPSEKKDTYFDDKVLQYYNTEFPKKVLDKIVIVSEDERLDSDFVDPTGWHVIDPFGYYIGFKTIKREIAQRICDTLYGAGRFRVIRTVKAAIR